MGALQALIPLGIITAALGVGGNLLGWVPVLFHGEVCPPLPNSPLALAAPLPARCSLQGASAIACALRMRRVCTA